MPNYRLAFKVGKAVPFYTKGGVWKFVRLATPRMVAHALKDFDEIVKYYGSGNARKRTAPHPVTKELDKKNCNQRTVNKIAREVNKRKFTPENAHIK